MAVMQQAILIYYFKLKIAYCLQDMYILMYVAYNYSASLHSV